MTRPTQSANLVEIVRKDESAPFSSQASDSPVFLRRNDFQSSTKLDALIQRLRKPLCLIVEGNINNL